MAEHPHSNSPARRGTQTRAAGLPGAQKLSDADRLPTLNDTSASQPDAANEAPTATAAPAERSEPARRRRDLLAAEDSAESSESRAPRRLPHGDSWAARTGRVLTRLVYTDAFPNAFAEAIDVCQSPVTTGRRIGVISPTGGSGASTITAAMAALFALVRTDQIAGVDFTPAPSGLIARLPAGEGDEGLSAGLGRLGEITHVDTDDVEPAAYGPSPRPRLLRLNYAATDRLLEPEEVAGLHRGLSRSRAVSVSEAPRPALNPALELGDFHALVVALSATLGARTANSDLLREVSRRVPGVPVLPVMVDSRRSPARTKAHLSAAARKTLRELGIADSVLRLDHDRHLATGGELRIDRIGEARRLQVARLSAAALEAAAGVRR